MKGKCFHVWCDGSHSAAGKRGAWGAVIQWPKGQQKEYQGIIQKCRTSSEAELWSILKSLQLLPDNASATVRCDCLSVVEDVKKLLIPLCTQKPLPILSDFLKKHVDMIRCIDHEIHRLKKIEVEWVKGHGDDQGNRLADRLAKEALRSVDDCKKTFNEKNNYPYWKTYVTPVNSLLMESGYLLKRGDAINITKYLCAQGILNSSEPYRNEMNPDLIHSSCHSADFFGLKKIAFDIYK